MMTFGAEKLCTKLRVPLFRVCCGKLHPFVVVLPGITRGKASGRYRRFIRVWAFRYQTTLYYGVKT